MPDVRVGSPELVAEMLALPGAVRQGHFALLSGLHTDRFVAFSAIAAHPQALSALVDWLAPVAAAWLPDAVLAPSTAGVSLGAALARRIGATLHLADLDDAGRPTGVVGVSLAVGARTVLVNDVVTTGSGMRLLADVARGAGASVVGAAWFASRAPIDVASAVGAPAVHVTDVSLPTFGGAECQQCHDAVPIQVAIDLN